MVLQSAFAHFALLLGFLCYLPPPPPLFCWCCVDKFPEVGSGLVVTAKIAALRCRYLHGTYPLVQLMRCFEYVFRSFFPDIRKRRTHVDLRRTYKQNGRTAIIATLVILSLLQTPAGSCLFLGAESLKMLYN